MMEFYLSERICRVVLDAAKSGYHPIEACVPQGRVLGPLLYLLYTVDIRPTAGTEMATFAGGTAITAVSESQQTATHFLQQAINSVDDGPNNRRSRSVLRKPSMLPMRSSTEIPQSRIHQWCTDTTE